MCVCEICEKLHAYITLSVSQLDRINEKNGFGAHENSRKNINNNNKSNTVCVCARATMYLLSTAQSITLKTANWNMLARDVFFFSSYCVCVSVSLSHLRRNHFSLRLLKSFLSFC